MGSKDFKDKNILIVGLGLMGCSFAEAFRDLCPQKIYGFDIDQKIVTHSQNIGLIDKGFTQIDPEIISQCDFIMVCLYLLCY